MTRAGCKPLGPGLVEHLEGSQRAKERLETILETIVGRLTVAEASQRLGICEAMFYRLRTEVLKAGLAQLEPHRVGRPPQQSIAEDAKRAELEHRIVELESELKIAMVREDIAHVMPYLAHQDPPLKKTTCLPLAKRRKR